MKFYLLLLLVLATGCGSKNSDPAAKAADPDAVPAGQHLIKVVYTGSGWTSAIPRLVLFQSTQNTAGKLVYPTKAEDWQETVDAKNGRILRIAYRDTAFALRFYAGSRIYDCNTPAPTSGTLRYQVYVDGRDQGLYQLRTASCGDQETLIDTKNLK